MGGAGMVIALILLGWGWVLTRRHKNTHLQSNYPCLIYSLQSQHITLNAKLRAILKVQESTIAIEYFLPLFEEEERAKLQQFILPGIKGKKTPPTLICFQEEAYLIDGFKASSDKLLITWHDISAWKKMSSNKHDEIAHLEKTVQSLQFVLDALPVPVWFRDGMGKLTFCNASYAKALDLPKDKIIAQNRLFWGYNSTSLKQELSEPLNYQVKKYLIFEGERRFMEFHETADATIGTAGYSVDLTDLKKAVSELERHTASYREVLENLSAGVAIYGSDRRVKFFNQAYSRMFDMDENWLYSGPTLGEVLDDLRLRRILPEHVDYAAYKKHQMQMINTILNPFQELIHLPDERTLRKIAAPHPLGGIFYIYEDLTDALAVERKYNIQLAVQKASLDNLYEGIAVFGSDGRLRLSNMAFQRIWTLSASQLKEGMHMSDIIEQCQNFFDHAELWAIRKEKLIALATDRIPKKKQIFREDGSVVDFSYHPLPDGSHLMSCIDITDSFKVERMLNTFSKVKAVKASRISASKNIHPLNPLAPDHAADDAIQETQTK
jgi:PAS domain-containing protein